MALAFTVALRLNHPTAYTMADPNLKPRIDEWMDHLKPQKCTRNTNTVLTGSGTKRGFFIVFDCYGENNWYAITIDNILIKEMKVIDWGEVKEELGS